MRLPTSDTSNDGWPADASKRAAVSYNDPMTQLCSIRPEAAWTYRGRFGAAHCELRPCPLLNRAAHAHMGSRYDASRRYLLQASFPTASIPGAWDEPEIWPGYSALFVRWPSAIDLADKAVPPLQVQTRILINPVLGDGRKHRQANLQRALDDGGREARVPQCMEEGLRIASSRPSPSMNQDGAGARQGHS